MIIDASVASKWIFVEEGSEAAASLVGREDLRAPHMLLAEVGNAMWKKGVRGELGERNAYAAQLGLVASLIELSSDEALIARALEIALVLEHPIYDCLYIALAEATDDVVVTADRRFIGKVSGSQFADRVRPLQA